MAGDASGGGSAGGAAAVAICAHEAPQKEPSRQQDEHLVERSKEMAQHLRHDPPKGGQGHGGSGGGHGRLAVCPQCCSGWLAQCLLNLLLLSQHLLAWTPSLPQAWTAAALCR